MKHLKSNNFCVLLQLIESSFLLQAFLEMGDENAAATMVNYYATGVAQLRGRAVYVQFSNHRELKTDQTHSNNAVSSPTNDVANTSEVCVILLASLLSRFTKLREWSHELLRYSRRTNSFDLLLTLTCFFPFLSMTQIPKVMLNFIN